MPRSSSNRPQRGAPGNRRFKWGALVRIIVVFVWTLGTSGIASDGLFFLARAARQGNLEYYLATPSGREKYATIPLAILSVVGIVAIILEIRALQNPGPRQSNSLFLAYAVWILLHVITACTFAFTMRGFG